MKEFIHPVLGTPRLWDDGGPRNRALPPLAAAAKGLPRELQQQTEARIRSHQFGQLMTPVNPDYARSVLRGALNGDLLGQWELFNLMEEWDRLNKNLNEVKNAVKRLSWNVKPYAERGKEPSPRAQEKADLVEAALRNWEPKTGSLEYSFEDFIYNSMDAMGKGISVQEIHWYQRDGALLPRAAHVVTPRQYAWNLEGSQLGLLDRISGGEWKEFPRNQFVVGQWHARSGVPGMTAMLRALVPYWIGATFGWRWLMQTAQLFGVPFRWATYDPAEPGLAATLGDMLETMGSTGYAAFPAGTVLEFKEAVTNARDNPQALIIDLGAKACDLLILGQELSSESSAAGLGSGTAMLQGKVRQDVLHNAAAWMASVLSYQIALPVLDLNYGEQTEAPCIEPDLSIDPDPKELAERDQILVNMGMKLPAEWAHERHGVPQPEDGEEVIEPGASLAQQQLTQPGLAQQQLKDGEMMARYPIHAKSATDQLIDHTLENLTGVQARWLGGVKPYFRKLIAAARDDRMSDAEFVQALEAAQRDMPELFGKLDTKALADALEAAMGAACVNGAVRGYLRRGAGGKAHGGRTATTEAGQ